MYLIGIDLDGTLLNDQGKLSSFTKITLGKVVEQGNKVVIATGRHPLVTTPILEELGLTNTYVSFNGAYIKLPSETLKFTYSWNRVSELSKVLKQRECLHVFGTESAYYVDNVYAKINGGKRRIKVPIKLVADVTEVKEPIFKTSILGKQEDMDFVEDWVAPYVADAGLVMFRSSEDSIDIVDDNVSKGKALALLAENFQVDHSQTMAFGNYLNDESMIAYANLGVAMENAPAKLKFSANYVTKSNEEDGVAIVLENNLLKQKVK
ncbi:Cof-type HAD-IIB family hydrolase [Evansella sp. AB-rgal1]|uniref:Cof-type HAD-IIB family hydrolase n=1 Tax=Evansella sp. AB-rgal1 TaxID=3242696 RepID=UPI00359E6573